MKRLLGFVIPLLLAAMICAPRVFSQQPPPEKARPSPKAAASPVAGRQSAPPLPSKDDLELKRQELEGNYNATKETLSAAIQQLAAGSNLSPQERRQLEVEQAKLRPQIKSYEEQLKLINQRLSQSSPGADAAAPVAAEAEAHPDETQIKVLALRNARATDAERIIRQLFGNDLHSIASDPRSNSLIIRGPAAETDIVYHLMVRLDEQSETSGSSATRSTTESRSGASVKAPANLASQYEAKEQEAERLAQQIRELQTKPKEHEWAIKDLSAQLRRAVTEAFAARQQLHQAEVGQLQERIVGIQQTLKTRDRLSKEIIDKRIKDLLNPDLQWERAHAGPSKTAATTGAASTASPATASSATLQRPKVTYGAWWGPEAEHVFAALGLTVQKLTKETAADPKYVGAAKITAIGPDSPAQELKVGDIIQSMMTIGTLPKITRATLQVIRGDEHFPVTVEFPSATTKSADSPKMNTAAALAVRDKLQERWKQVEKLFGFGRVPLAETLQAAKDLNEAEIAGAASENEERESRKAALDRLKQIKSIVDAKVAEGAEPERHKLTVDAEVLKFEAELTAKAQRPTIRRAGGEKTAAPSEAGDETSPTATREYRDILRQRVELLKSGYLSGEFPYSDFMRSLVELDDAEIAAAATAQERQAARKAKLDHLKEAATAIERLVNSGEVTQTDLLGAQAELLKAEAELSAGSSRGKAAAEAPTTVLPGAGNFIVDGRSQAITLRKPDEFREELAARERRVEQLRSEDPKKFSGDPAIVKEQLEQAAQRARRELEFLRGEYAAQIRLLELEAKDAASAVESAKQAQEIAKSLYQQGRANYGQINESQRAQEAAKLREERANTLLELYRKADPKQAPQPPTSGEPAEAAAK